jgi:Fe-S cluster assembly iron-binding protein IscA
MKKIVSIGLLCLAIFVGFCFCDVGVEVKAAGNDNYDNAAKLKSDKAESATLNKDEADWYIYEVENSVGVEWLDLKSSTPDGNHFWITIYKSDDGIPSEQIIDTGWVNNYTSQEFSFSKKTVLFVRVGGDAGFTYSLTMKTDKTPLSDCEWALEDDDNYDNANVITSSNKVCALLNTGDDVDWYRYNVKNDKPFSFKNQSTMPDGNHFWLTVYKSEDGIPTEKIADTGWVNNYTSQEFSYSKGTVIYVRVSGDRGIRYKLSVNDSNEKGSKDTSNDVETYSILAGTNVVVGKAEAGATVNVKYGKKTYKATADENGIYRVKTAKLKKGKKVTIWQTVGKTSSEKISVKVVEKY